MKKRVSLLRQLMNEGALVETVRRINKYDWGRAEAIDRLMFDHPGYSPELYAEVWDWAQEIAASTAGALAKDEQSFDSLPHVVPLPQ